MQEESGRRGERLRRNRVLRQFQFREKKPVAEARGK